MIGFKNINVVFPDRIRNTCVVVSDGKITDICDRFDENEIKAVDGNGLYLSPGFIDAHVHGGGNFSAMSKNPNDIVKMAEAHLKFGTTSIVPTTLAAPIKQLKEAKYILKLWMINYIKKKTEYERERGKSNGL